ncbi:unnamed protein product [Trifolium pratense]|uniref:Uncharacterized protein n=1 Tax=Trifolium pratense TaxID=57577 RepID=A0ACB0M701_TRIPR|nr:unnamed protein product [Trifolium pratense]
MGKSIWKNSYLLHLEEHFQRWEMIVVDSNGDDIFIIVSNELKLKFEKEIPMNNSKPILTETTRLLLLCV